MDEGKTSGACEALRKSSHPSYPSHPVNAKNGNVIGGFLFVCLMLTCLTLNLCQKSEIFIFIFFFVTQKESWFVQTLLVINANTNRYILLIPFLRAFSRSLLSLLYISPEGFILNIEWLGMPFLDQSVLLLQLPVGLTYWKFTIASYALCTIHGLELPSIKHLPYSSRK